jgi:hypothetical protein
MIAYSMILAWFAVMPACTGFSGEGCIGIIPQGCQRR